MISLQQVSFSALLPPNLQDVQARALGAAWDKVFRKLVDYAERVSMTFAFVMELDEEMADHLCLSLDIKGYKADLSLQKKRLLIRSALLNYSRMGTKAALEDAVGIIHGGTTVQENWEYGGQPYFFRVAGCWIPSWNTKMHVPGCRELPSMSLNQEVFTPVLCRRWEPCW